MSDESREVRAEDAFDTVAVADWLRTHAEDPDLRPLLETVPQVRQFPGGASNLTYRLTYPQVSLILRRPPVGTKASGAHDMGREFRVQKALAPHFPLVPTMVAFCPASTSEEVAANPLGQEFYVMSEVAGTIPRRDLVPGPDGPLTPEQTSELCGNAFGVLVDLHSVDVEQAGLQAFGKGTGYVGRQVSGWTARLENARTEDLGDWSDITDWLAAHQPDDVATCLIHNDFRLDNLVFSACDPLQVAGVLDWEMATLGDPLMDLGGALAYWVSESDDEFFRMFRRQPSNAPGMWSREEIVAWYCDRMGFDMTPERWRFYEAFGLFRLAVIAQQIWYRYSTGQTTNEAFAVFGPAVGYLENRCRTVIGA